MSRFNEILVLVLTLSVAGFAMQQRAPISADEVILRHRIYGNRRVTIFLLDVSMSLTVSAAVQHSRCPYSRCPSSFLRRAIAEVLPPLFEVTKELLDAPGGRESDEDSSRPAPS